MLRELSLPVLGELREVLRETAQLAVPVGADVLYVDRLESNGVGTMFHTELYRRGPGPLVQRGEGDRRATTRRWRGRSWSAGSCGARRSRSSTRTATGRCCAQVRVDGFAASREEHTMGMSSIAAPVVLRRGERTVAVAAISVVGATSRVLGARKIAVVQSVRQGGGVGLGRAGAVPGVVRRSRR